MDILSIIGISCLASIAITTIVLGILYFRILSGKSKAIKMLEDYFLNEVIQKP